MGAVSDHPVKPAALPDDDSRKLLQRILESPEFRRAPRLKELLIYICDRAFEQTATEIREQELGARIFGRAESYNTAEDPIVRVQVSQLRKKLKLYFENEGKSEACILDVPRGTYLPVFSQKPEPAERADASPPHPVRARRNFIVWAAAAVLCIAGLAAVIRLATMSRPDATPVLRKFWANLIQPDQRTTVILADSCLAFAQDITHHPVTLREYLAHDPGVWFSGLKILPAEAHDLELLMTRQYTSLADINGMRRILLANPRNQQEVNVVFARDFRIRGVSSDNLVLLGSRRSDPWVELFDSRLNFEFDYDEPSMKAFIRNRSPLPGEQAFYKVNGLGLNITEGYADIALLPSAGGLRKVLLLQGTDMEATEAAGDIVANEDELGKLLARVAPNTSVVPFFEALYETHRLAGAPRQAQLLAVRRIHL
jgi:hypothetical protein